ncbi:hypothetical protein B0H17DRAFT_184593 [Mycena rosella]|uniref:RRM domain-containing protein n=1 Tax=Mycena rosella TaxID=1033263 RepID=A0AAD7G6W0_MYCRO|nr:hypothetical protein B0H17DRAFT_184593 [Mycena rosella]
MSLSSLLLPKKKIDKELDDLFKSNPLPSRKPATPIHVPTPGSAPPAKKRKIEAAIPDPPQSEKKRAKGTAPVTPKTPAKPAKSPAQPASTSTKKSKRKEAVVESDSDGESAEEEDEDNSDLENAYLGKKTVGKPAAPAADEDEDESDGEANASDDADSDSDPDAPPPVHESLTKRVRTKPTKKTKVVPEGETPAQRDARTLFVGGLPVEVAQKKPLQKQLARHLLAFLPPGSKVKIESTRFRSVAFRDPTSSTALSTPAPASNVTANAVPIPPSANHATTRASTWRQDAKTQAVADAKTQAAADGDAQKAYLTPAQKKKILFIQGAFHPEAASVNAYVVLAHPAAGDEEGTDTPYAAAAHLARAANAADFAGRALRVDVCGLLPDADAGGEGVGGDPKRSVFVGNLDFAAREGDVREFFEGVVAAERGPALSATSDAEDGDGDGNGDGEGRGATGGGCRACGSCATARRSSARGSGTCGSRTASAWTRSSRSRRRTRARRSSSSRSARYACSAAAPPLAPPQTSPPPPPHRRRRSRASRRTRRRAGTRRSARGSRTWTRTRGRRRRRRMQGAWGEGRRRRRWGCGCGLGRGRGRGWIRCGLLVGR